MANKIKVVACDIDGTLLDDNHKITTGNKNAIKNCVDHGIRFIVSTGRNFNDTKTILKDLKVNMDYVVASGSEVRDEDGMLKNHIYMDQSNFSDIYDIIKEYNVAVRFCANNGDYYIGTEDEIRTYMFQEYKHFFKNISEEEILNTTDFNERLNKCHCIDDINYLRINNVGIYKIFIFSYDKNMLSKLGKRLDMFNNIAIAASFPTNLELTHIDAQKGIALEKYILSLGYKKNDVMVIGDSLNDYSMFDQGFKVRVAMENSMKELFKMATHITKSNNDSGVAYAINLMMSGRLDEIKNNL